MSTTFAVHIDNLYEYGTYQFGNDRLDEFLDGNVEVAFRSSGHISIINPLMVLLPDNTPVIPLDNTSQGIYTIGDIKKEILNKNKK